MLAGGSSVSVSPLQHPGLGLGLEPVVVGPEAGAACGLPAPCSCTSSKATSLQSRDLAQLRRNPWT